MTHPAISQLARRSNICWETPPPAIISPIPEFIWRNVETHAPKEAPNLLATNARHVEVLAAYDKAFALEPDMIGLESSRLNLKLRICDWSNIESACAHFISSVRGGKIRSPFQFLAISSSSADRLQCAKLLIANRYPPSQKPLWQGERYDHRRIRVAYLSSDFREHAMSFLAAGMFECHDKSHFDVTAISCGPDDNSELRQRLKASFEHFIDATTTIESLPC